MRLEFHYDLNICSLFWYSTLMNFVSFLLWSDSKPAGDVSHSWFDAQKQCLHHGLTIEKDKSDQPYWTGVYRRLTPWINILGHYLLFSLFLSSVNISFYIIFNFLLLDFVWVFFLFCFFCVCVCVFSLHYKSNFFSFLNKFECRSFCFKDAIPIQPTFCSMWLIRLRP